MKYSVSLVTLLGAVACRALLPSFSDGLVIRSSYRPQCGAPSRAAATRRWSTVAPVPTASAAASYDASAVAGKRAWLNFAAFGFANRTCQLAFEANGNCTFSEGMISKEEGAWRIEREDGIDYLQFTSPLTDLYSEIFDVPSRLLFWRAELRPGGAGAGGVGLRDGVIISERKALFGLKTNFIREGNFTGRMLGKDEAFPREVRAAGATSAAGGFGGADGGEGGGSSIGKRKGGKAVAKNTVRIGDTEVELPPPLSSLDLDPSLFED